MGNVKAFPRDSGLMQSLVHARERKEQLDNRLFVHFYLNESGYCLNCTAVFKLTDAGCPGCGSTTVFSLTNWVSPDPIRPKNDGSVDWRDQHCKELENMR